MRPLVVRQGEYLTQLAARHGFDGAEVWNAAENGELRERRRSPEMLLPGDVLQIPAREAARARVELQSDNQYRCRVPTASIRVRFESEEGPIAGEACTIEGLGAPRSASTDGNGTMTIAVQVTVRTFDVVFDRTGHRQHILVGHLDPEDTSSGVAQRLQNLGFGALSAAPDALTNALRAFQNRNGLPITGVADEETRRRLSANHGS